MMKRKYSEDSDNSGKLDEIKSKDANVLVIEDDEVKTTKTTLKKSKKAKNIERRQANKDWKLIERKVGSGVDPNPRHTLYYKTQLPNELGNQDDWDRFQEVLNNPLSVTFRIGTAAPLTVRRSIRKRCDLEFKKLQGKFVEIRGQILHDNIVKRCGMFIGDKSNSNNFNKDVWQVSSDSSTLSQHPSLQTLSDFLFRENLLGHVVRQELASMIPALMLDVQSHHLVLDVCAAPGSKTEQLLTIMNSRDTRTPTGMVIANDADPKRILTLKNRYKRSGYPNLLITCSRAEDLEQAIGKNVFDRIVADVPCSGDGTFRKQPHLWRLFRPRMALELHSIQLQIAKSSVQMLKPGGRMIYSTCSLNPIENEAVVAELLRIFKGSLKLVDTRQEGLLPNLISRRGISSWHATKDIFSIGDNERDTEQTFSRMPPILRSMQPPSEEEIKDFNLHLCHRILPNDQDTGGFFVSVLELVTDNKTKSKNHITETKAMETLRSLGFNPKSSKEPTKIETFNSIQHMLQLNHYSNNERNVCSEFLKHFHLNKNIVDIGMNDNANEKPLYLIALPNIVESVPKNDKQPIKKRQNDDKTLFGSKSQGWKKNINDDDDNDDNDSVEESMSIYLMSEKVENALKKWKHSKLIVQAGALVGQAISDDTNSLISLEPNGVSCLLPCIKKDSIDYLDKDEFVDLLKLAVRVSDAMTLDDVLDNESLSESCREKINNMYMKNRNNNAMFQIIITINYENDDKNDITATNPNTEKRRLSKADRKKIKKGGLVQTKEKPNELNDENPRDDENARDMALVLTIIDDEDDVYVKISISKEVAESYIAAVSQ